MKILLFNQDWFAPEFKAAGHEVLSFGMASHLEVRQERLLMELSEVLAALPAGFIPDVLVFHDNSSPLGIVGLDESPIPSLFYSVDSHHHAGWHKYVAHLFDETLIAHRDYAGPFEQVGITPHWFPVWASRYVEPEETKEHGAVFVGTLNPKLNAERVKFFGALEKKVPLLCLTGAWWEIFPKSEIVINQTVKGDLNFRVFEAMMCGAHLLTERTENGLLALFREGQHLSTYSKGAVDEAADRISYLLAHPSECRSVGAQGREEILKHHLPIHRAQEMLERLSTLTRTRKQRRHFGAVVNFGCIAKLLEQLDQKIAFQALFVCFQAAERALQAHEPITFEIACHIVRAAERIQTYTRGDEGRTLLYTFAEAYPDETILKLAAVRALLNEGKRDKAKALALQLVPSDEEALFSRAEDVVRTILGA